ncbi:MAG TPA: PAS domain S-box protein, partial [Syntrophobacter fumaroxidans]|nr:PAS domain S-box protein [Syntrophobacter fumaroxidans]
MSAGIACALLLSFALLVFSALASADIPRILLIHSYNSNTSWTTEIEKGMREALSEQYGPVSFQLEFMDTRHNSGTDYHERLKSLLTYKLQGRSFDIVLTSDNDAFAFVRANRTQLFPTVPVVFCGINSFTRSMLAGVSGMTGIAEDVSVRETLDMALELHPGLKRIVVIGLTTIPADRANREAFVEQVRTGYERLEFDFWDAVDTDELAKRLPLLGPDTIVVINGIIAEPDGRMLGFAETTAFIRARSSVPLYTLWDVYHYGTLGGKMVTGRMQGRLAGGLAARILKGEAPDKIPVVHSTSANQYIFDQNELSRFRISEDRLPVDSVITNKPSPFYMVDKTFLRTGIAAFLLLACIVVLLAVNIAARKKAEKSLIEGQRWQKALFDNITDFVWMKDRQGHVLAYNESFRLAFRWEPGAVLGKTDYDLFPASVADRMRKDDEDVIASRVRGHLEESFEMPGGETRWFDTIKTPVFDKSGRVMGTVGSARDITERKRAEAALARSENKLKRIIEDSPLPICWADEKGRVEFVNQAFVDLLGYRLEDIPTAEEWFRRAYPDEPFRKETEAQWGARIAAARSEGTKMCPTECNVTCKDGSVRTVEIMNTLLEDAILAVFKDTTERRRVEAALHESEQRFKTLAEASFEGIALTDNGILVDLTEQFANMLACDRNELLGRNVLEFVSPEFRDRAARAQALDETGPYEFNALRKDGSTFPVEVRARSTLIGGRRLRL